jgi:hypothetical protein
LKLAGTVVRTAGEVMRPNLETCQLLPFLPRLCWELYSHRRRYLIVMIEIASFNPRDSMKSAAVSLQGWHNPLCSHDQQHLAGLQWLLCRIAALPAKA